MFACSLYPSDEAFLEEVREEVRFQAKRLSSRASLALWCGDNEVIGALTWYKESRENRDRYLASYIKLNTVIEESLKEAAPGHPFWPSSPCNGVMDFGDGWHEDGSGDMHFWDVWHSGASFDAYYLVKPRFCSEFGFQSLPSEACIRKFAPPSQRNITSPVMESHQKNPSGNSIILEMISRNFYFPASFRDQIYLSRLQQALAVTAGISYWRSLKPLCMGTLYWQLNDNWPAISWSSLEYGGAWKPLHYGVRRACAPCQTSVFLRDNHLEIRAVHDRKGERLNVSVTLSLYLLSGEKAGEEHFRKAVPFEKSVSLLRRKPKKEEEKRDRFFVCRSRWEDEKGRVIAEEETPLYLHPFKHYDWPSPRLKTNLRAPSRREKAEEAKEANQGQSRDFLLSLESETPLHYLTLSGPEGLTFSDNSFYLPAREKRELILRLSAPLSRESLEKELEINSLNHQRTNAVHESGARAEKA